MRRYVSRKNADDTRDEMESIMDIKKEGFVRGCFKNDEAVACQKSRVILGKPLPAAPKPASIQRVGIHSRHLGGAGPFVKVVFICAYTR
jgi:hypothetical protein